MKNARIADALDLLFEHRNKSYGAYQLRREYPRHLARALGFCFLFVAAFIAVPDILSAVGNILPKDPPTETVAVLGPPPALEKPAPPPVPPPTPPPPARAQQRFVPPAVVDDNNAPDEPQNTIDDLNSRTDDIGATDQTGPAEGPPTLDEPSEPGPAIEYKPPVDDREYESFRVNKMPSFPGGDSDLLAYLAKQIVYPPLARENNIQGVVVLSFLVDQEGAIRDVKVIKEIGGGCGKEAARVVMAMPRWSAGEVNGHAVKVRFMLPVRFQLN